MRAGVWGGGCGNDPVAGGETARARTLGRALVKGLRLCLKNNRNLLHHLKQDR